MTAKRVCGPGRTGDSGWTRRSRGGIFLNATLLGSGAALLHRPAPLHARPRQASSPLPEEVPNWGGYGGIGDYANSYGNTEPVVRAAHAVREGRFDKLPPETIDTGEEYDLVVVGGGFSGLGAAYEFKRSAFRPSSSFKTGTHELSGSSLRATTTASCCGGIAPKAWATSSARLRTVRHPSG